MILFLLDIMLKCTQVGFVLLVFVTSKSRVKGDFLFLVHISWGKLSVLSYNTYLLK